VTSTKAILKQHLEELDKACAVLRYSFEKCRRIGFSLELSADDLESFEALTSRFARFSDILTQKAFRAIETLDLDEPGTVRDRIHRAEKKGLIESAEKFIEIRLLRNEIAHEYKPESVYDIFERVLLLTPVLLACVDRIEAYIKRQYEI
jgi:uncharacterized protein YutE (UPF0331/DUF86 family)